MTTDVRTEARDELARRWGATSLEEAAAAELATIAQGGLTPGAWVLARELRYYIGWRRRHVYPPPIKGRPRDSDPDWVNIERAVHGQPVPDLVPSEIREAIEYLLGHGANNATIAGLLRMSPTTVSRYRAALRKTVA
jgi:hypothetical protein